MDLVVDLGEHALCIPPESKSFVFLYFQALEFFDKVKLEFWR
jgi:hypothetical protein